jgi:hypothetical protein
MLKPSRKFETKKVKTIRKELLINGGDLDIYLDLFLTDENGKTEKVLTKKGDSIVANFLRILYLQMGRDVRDNVMGGTFYKVRSTIVANGSTSISSISAGVSNKIRLTFSNSVISTTETTGKVTLGGFQGVDIDGRYTFTRINDAVIDLEGTTYSAGWTTGTGGVSIYVPITNLSAPSYYSFNNIGIVIGTGTTPVVIDDGLLEKQIPSMAVDGGLTYNTSTVSQDTNDATSAQITFTRTFTNNASLTVQVNEIGLLMRAGSSGHTILTMRDIIPDGVNVAAGKTLTVNYRIKTILGTGTDPGGFVANFMRLLYRHAGSSSRAVFDINNTSRTHRENLATFGAVKCGGFNIEYYTSSNEGEYGWKHGIVVGLGETAVSMGDYNLETSVEHGDTSNKMLYYGGFAENFTIGGDYAQFDIYKAIENNSGSTIQIKEYGLVGGAGDASTASDTNHYMRYLYLLARNILTVPEDVLDGEILKVIYTIRVIVTGGESS